MVQPKKDDGKNKEKDEGNQTYGAPIYITKLVHGRTHTYMWLIKMFFQRVFLQHSFKNFKIGNYFLKKLNISIFNALIIQIFIKFYYLKSFESAPETFVNIFYKKKIEPQNNQSKLPTCFFLR